MTHTTDSQPENWRAPWQSLQGRPESETQEDTQAEPRPQPMRAEPQPHEAVAPTTTPHGEYTG